MAGRAGPTFIEEARRRQIAEAAVEVLAEVGYAKATFARIAARAGVSPALISYHFTSKAALMAGVVAHVEGALEAAIVEEVGEPPSYAEALRRVIVAQVRWFARHRTEVLALGQVYDQAGRAGDGDLGAESRRKGIGEIETMLREGQVEGELGHFDVHVVAVSLMAALEAVPRELFAEPGTDVDAYARALADLFVAATR